MIKHFFKVISAGHDPKPDLNDFEVVHVFYKLDTINYDVESNTVVEFASTGLQVLELDPWNPENKIPGTEVSNETLEQWVLEKIDLEQLKATNVANLAPKPK